MTWTTAPAAPTVTVAEVRPEQPAAGAAVAAVGRRRHPALPLVGCVLAYVALAVLVYLPVLPLDGSHIPLAGGHNPAGEDPFQMTWFLSWLPYALTHGQSLFHTNFMEYPSGVNLADNTSVPLLGLLGWPVTSTLGPIAAFNLLVRVSFAASATSMFFVLRRWCRSWQAPFIGGLLYAFGPYTTAQSLHLDLIFVPFPPLLVLLGDELVRRQRLRPVLLGLLIGLVLALQYLVSPDITSACVVLGAVAGIGLAIAFRHEFGRRVGYVVRALAAGAVAFAVICGYPLFEVFAGPGHLTGPVIRVWALQQTQADALGSIIPTSNQQLVPSFLTHFGDELVNGNLSENGSYLGLPLLAVLVVAVRRLRRDATVVAFAGLGLAAFVLSLGPSLVIGTWHSPVPLPETVFGHLPLLDNTIPARYTLFVVMFAALVLGIAVDRLWLHSRVVTDEGRGPGIGPLSRRVAVVGALVALTLLPNAPFQSRALPWSALPAAVETAVKPGSVVLSYPLATPASTDALAWQAIDHMDFRLVGGYANIAVPGQRDGRRWPLLLKPASVFELLGYTTFGDKMPPPPRPTPAIEAQLRTFLRRYSIGAVVAWTGYPLVETSETAERLELGYLRRALGPPSLRRSNFEIWLPGHGSWPRPRA